MKKLLFLFTLILNSSFLIHNCLAQSPEMFNYQAVARGSDGKALVGQEVILRIAIMSEANLDRPAYAEEHTVLTNQIGLFNLHIGAGERLEGNMQTIDWGSGAHYLSVEIDTEGFGNFEQMGTSQLLSVPYALYASRSGSSPHSNSDGGNRDDPNDWTMNGNTGTDDATDFLGTTDEQDLVIKTNNAEVARLTTSGDLNISTGGRILFNGDNGISVPGTQNVAIGVNAGENISSGYGNAMIGYQAGQSNTTGRFNAFIGYRSGQNTTVGIQNTFIGYQAGEDNLSGGTNVAIGWNSATELTTGNNNVAIGGNAGKLIDSGSNNIFIGRNSGQNTTTSDNTFIGFLAGNDNTTGRRNTYIGYGTGGNETIENATAIGYNATVTQSNSLVLGNDVNVGIGTSAPDADLHVEGTLKLVDGTQADGYVLTSDANGNASWQIPPTDTDDQTLSLNSDTLRIEGGNWVSLSTFWNTDNQTLSINGNTLSIQNGNSVEISTDTLTIVSDTDGDTKIQVEESADEDVIRFDIGGTEHFAMVGPTLEVLNTGSSVFIGDNAGANDDLSNNQNVFIGNNSGTNNTTGSPNTAVGTGALLTNTTGSFNVALGYQALYDNTTGGRNIAIGPASLGNNTTGEYNNAVGLNTLATQTSDGNYNNAFGAEALEDNTTGDNNSAFGDLAMNRNTTGGANTVVGAQALENNQTGSYNVVVGYRAGENTTGSSNVFLGYNAGRSETGSNKLYIENTNSSSPLIYGEFDNDAITINGSLSVVDGTQSDGYVLTSNASGNASWQATVGDNLGDHTATENIQTNGNYISNDGDDEGIYLNSNGRVAIGGSTTNDMLHITGPDATNSDGTRLRVESTTNGYAGMAAINSQRNMFIGIQGAGDTNPGEFHIYDNTAGARRMVITSAGNVGIGYSSPSYKLRVNGQVAGTSAYVNTSDAKYKTNVEPISAALEKLLLLKGVSYDWKTKEFPEHNFDNRHQLGFIAQDVESVVPEAVSITEEGDYGLSYSTFIPLLVEALKEQQQLLQQQQRQIDELKSKVQD